jgi:hypothetical protein
MARRSAQDWARLIREFERSGQRLGAFAAARGIRPETLSWWRWRLGRKQKAGQGPKKPARVRLVSVEATESMDGATFERVVCELVTPSGYTLRVFDVTAVTEVLRATVAAMQDLQQR